MDVPVYIKIHNELRRDIEGGKWRVGERIPSERDLAVDFHVSRMTLRQAIQTLVEEGILERRVGAGTYVASQKVQEKVSGVTSFTDLITAEGKTPSSKTISYHVAKPSISECKHLNIPETAQVLRMERVRYGDDVPICFETATVPYELVRDFPKRDVSKSLYHVLENKAGLTLGGAHQTISAMLASEQVAEYLQVKRGSAILRVRQVSYLQDHTPFEYVRTQYVGERFEFTLDR
ncbi:GntR family transcriptional regulator [Lacticaseibacillus nasuensis]|uniref:GntR family transcriptional regulator n=1 Tax=Lacticaseibacillus nasuensis TaxID=944671 RepID=UPI000704A33D|nr:GntR family transcriptional regulator [Lacticaseibacillus nasuensis]